MDFLTPLNCLSLLPFPPPTRFSLHSNHFPFSSTPPERSTFFLIKAALLPSLSPRWASPSRSAQLPFTRLFPSSTSWSTVVSGTAATPRLKCPSFPLQHDFSQLSASYITVFFTFLNYLPFTASFQSFSKPLKALSGLGDKVKQTFPRLTCALLPKCNERQ